MTLHKATRIEVMCRFDVVYAIEASCLLLAGWDQFLDASQQNCPVGLQSVVLRDVCATHCTEGSI